jgi:hypothetical protein
MHVFSFFLFQMHSFLFVGNHKSQPTQDYSRTSNIVRKERGGGKCRENNFLYYYYRRIGMILSNVRNKIDKNEK